jgi:hypothetical protein
LTSLDEREKNKIMTQYLNEYVPGLRFGAKILSSEVLGAGIDDFANIWYVDGDNGSNSNVGNTPSTAFKTIQAAVSAASTDDIVFIRQRDMAVGATDPVSYAESVTIPATADRLKLIGYSTGRVQQGVPQIKPAGTTHVYCLTVNSPGCLIANLGFNGNSTAGAPLNGAILLNSNGATGTISAAGTTIQNCHFKNCAGTTVTDATTGGAIDWTANGDCWQVLIKNNRFYKNVCDICLLGTSNSVPQDVVIQENIFSGPTASVDCNLYLAGGSGMNGVIVDNNNFGPIGTLGSGTVLRLISATGCIGMFSRNMCQTTGKTYGAAGSGGLVPTTMMIAGNYQDNALIART